MNVNFNTNSFLQRNRFVRTRKFLRGEQSVSSWARLGEVTLYSAEQAREPKKPWFFASKTSKFKNSLDNCFLAFNKITSKTPHASTTSAWLNTRIESLANRKAKRIARLSRFKHRPKRSKNKLISLFLSLITVLSVLFAAVLFIPAAYYFVFPADIIEMTPREKGSVLGGQFDLETVTTETQAQSSPTPEPYVPPKDETLPEGDWLIIPRIGVRTPLRKTENPDVALEKGVWHVPNFGVPGDRSQPMILAAHRFGWQWWWKDEYWKYNSFYNLPTTEPGDLIEVISDQRKWIYEIYAGEEGEEITDYHSDLILYTCKYLQSPIRHFRYARIIDPTMMTQ